MSYFANSLAFARHILDDQPVQIISTAAMLAILWVLIAGDGALLARARDVQGLGVFVLLPFGFKVTFIYFLLYVVCTTYGATPPLPSQSPDPEYRAVLPETDPDDHWAPPTRSMSSLRPQTIQLPVRGWSIDVKFSLESPHVVLEEYHFNFAEELDKNLAIPGRSGTVDIEYTVNPTDNRELESDLLFDKWDARLKIIHRQHRRISIYEFTLTQVSIPLPIDKIPPQLRKGGAGGNRWSIKAPDFPQFRDFVQGALKPEQQVVSTTGNFSDTQYFEQIIPSVDLAQVRVFIIVPILKAISFGSNSLYGGVYHSPFYGDTKNFTWDSLTCVSLFSVQIFARDYRAILEASPNLRTMKINRPGEGDGGPELQEPDEVVRANRLKTLHLTNCKVDVRDFLSASVVDLPEVTELVLSCHETKQSFKAHEMGVKWEGIHILKLSNTFGGQFIHDCEARLSTNSMLEIISV
ncbi:hypothetical protein F5050DRAFT_1711354 [Lentinula boryana]|uniref:Uncharacterized protein n=1 Tax=Lentinula boryana TaxID=40481 RepID=A0ABQ8QFP9_9AGAR|nr:hypothetical protein F5050DRAFT_1711354 [Lentinula boryana]